MKKKYYDCTVIENYIAHKAKYEEEHKSSNLEKLKFRKFAIENEIQRKPNGVIDCAVQLVSFPISIITATLTAIFGVIGGFATALPSALMSTSKFDAATDEVKSKAIDNIIEMANMVMGSITKIFFVIYIVVILVCVCLLCGKQFTDEKKYKLGTMLSIELEVVNQKISEIENHIISTNKPKQTPKVKVNKVHRNPKPPLH